jgi:hypothetical protein
MARLRSVVLLHPRPSRSRLHVHHSDGAPPMVPLVRLRFGFVPKDIVDAGLNF